MNLKLTPVRYISLILLVGLRIASKTEKKENQEAVATTTEMTDKKIELISNNAERKVDVLIDGKLFTVKVPEFTLVTPYRLN